MVELPDLAMVGSSCGLRGLKAVGSSHGLAVDPFDVQTVERVPLLSQEGLTCRLLPGAAAPWSPALGPVSKFPALDQEFSSMALAPAQFVVETVDLAGSQFVLVEFEYMADRCR